MFRLLIADDDADQMLDLLAAAERAGVQPGEIVQATSEEGAYARIAEQTFQLAVVDLMLSHPPGREEGLRVIRRLREVQPDCRIIAITTKVGTESGVRCLEAGAHDFISSKWLYANWLKLLSDRLRIWKGVVDRAPAGPAPGEVP